MSRNPPHNIRDSILNLVTTEDDENFQRTGDFFVATEYITKLDRQNFYSFISETDVSMVMFYDPSTEDCYYSKKQFNCDKHKSKKNVSIPQSKKSNQKLCSDYRTVILTVMKRYNVFYIIQGRLHKTTEVNVANMVLDKEEDHFTQYSVNNGEVITTCPSYITAAHHMKRDKRKLYGVLNCVVEPDICSEQQVNSLPLYKMYSRGHTVNTISDFNTFTAAEMIKLMKRCQVFSEPVAAMKPCNK